MRRFRSDVGDQRLETDLLMERHLARVRANPGVLFEDGALTFDYSDNRYFFAEVVQRAKDGLVLDLGCGDGSSGVHVLLSGARRVCAVDISKNAALAARMAADRNAVGHKLDSLQMDARELAYRDEVFDMIIGRAVLHHFKDDDLAGVMAEVYRVLKTGGEAVFLEPIEDSNFFERVQQVIPAGRPDTGYYRPSSLSLKQSSEYMKLTTDAVLTTKVLFGLGREFEDVRITRFGLLIRLDRFCFGHPWGRKAIRLLDYFDRVIFGALPFIHRYCRTVVVSYCKASA